jgi:hypothetical protein
LNIADSISKGRDATKQQLCRLRAVLPSNAEGRLLWTDINFSRDRRSSAIRSSYFSSSDMKWSISSGVEEHSKICFRNSRLSISASMESIRSSEVADESLSFRGKKYYQVQIGLLSIRTRPYCGKTCGAWVFDIHREQTHTNSNKEWSR